MHKMEIVNINSKTAAVKVDNSFNGTEDEVKKIATDIGQFDNVANYRIDNGYVVFAFDEDLSEKTETNEDNINEKIIKAAFDYFDVSEAVMAIFREKEDVN